MFKITYYNQKLDYVVTVKYDSLEKAQDAANKIFEASGVIVGIDHDQS